MHRLIGHAGILAAGAVGAVLSLEILHLERPSHARVGAAIVAADPPAMKPLPASAAQAQYTRIAASPGDREAMARALQRELKRVGCYQGDVTGVWGSQSRQAMGAFTDAMKLRLPIDVPDEMLLKLVQGQGPKVCGGPDLDPEQAAIRGQSVSPQPRLVAAPVEVKRNPRRAAASEQQATPETTPPQQEARNSDRAPAATPPPRTADKTPRPPKFVRNLIQSVNEVLGPFGLQ